MGLRVGGRILIALILLSMQAFAQKTAAESEIEVGLRMIGHQVLLYAQDTTSNVLPIEKEGDRYRISFDAEFSFVPEELVTTIDEAVRKTSLASTYIIEVQRCETGEVVYSFKMDETAQSDIVPCQSRIQEKGCYTLLFYSLEWGEDETFIPPTVKASDNSKVAGISSSLVAMTLTLVVGMMLFFLWKRGAGTDPDLVALGSYQFDTRNIVLIQGEDRIPLTSKEADLLILLNDSANKTVPKEVLLNKVWGDEGDYIGRTLDVFISKLRKKLEADPDLRIINARGVGYKLVKRI